MVLFLLLAAAALLLSLLLLSRTIYVLVQIRSSRKNNQSFCRRVHRSKRPLRTLVVLGSGGHTSEILALVEDLSSPRNTSSKGENKKQSDMNYAFVFCKADSDTTSVQRLQSLKKRKRIPMATTTTTSSNDTDNDHEVEVHNIPRSREVGQSYWTSIFTTTRAQLYAFLLLFRVAPDLILVNGPGTCLPICVAALLSRILGIMPYTRVVFVESLCRVQTLSLTGKLLYPVADLFCVHWPELQRKFKLTQRIRTFVGDDESG